VNRVERPGDFDKQYWGWSTVLTLPRAGGPNNRVLLLRWNPADLSRSPLLATTKEQGAAALAAPPFGGTFSRSAKCWICRLSHSLATGSGGQKFGLGRSSLNIARDKSCETRNGGLGLCSCLLSAQRPSSSKCHCDLTHETGPGRIFEASDSAG